MPGYEFIKRHLVGHLDIETRHEEANRECYRNLDGGQDLGKKASERDVCQRGIKKQVFDLQICRPVLDTVVVYIFCETL